MGGGVLEGHQYMRNNKSTRGRDIAPETEILIDFHGKSVLSPSSMRCSRQVFRSRQVPRLSGLASFAASLALTLGACEPSVVVLPTMTFEEAFVLVDSLELEQTPDLPIVGIESVDLSADGEILVADPLDARLSLFAPSGELLQVFGRRGQGPGEFEYPTHARFDERGDIHVVDLARRLISVFSRTGELKRDVPLPIGLDPFGLEVGEQRHYWVLGTMASFDGSENVLFKLDTLGNITAEYLPLANARPRGQRDHQDWRSIRTASITTGRSGLFVSLSLLDSVWAIDEASGRVRSWAIRPEGYVPPSLPERPIRGGPAMMDWLEASQRAAGIWGNDEYLIVPFASGFYHRAERSIASYRDPNGLWHTLVDTPVILGSKGSTLVALARPIGERVVINMFELR